MYKEICERIEDHTRRYMEEGGEPDTVWVSVNLFNQLIEEAIQYSRREHQHNMPPGLQTLNFWSSCGNLQIKIAHEWEEDYILVGREEEEIGARLLEELILKHSD